MGVYFPSDVNPVNPNLSPQSVAMNVAGVMAVIALARKMTKLKVCLFVNLIGFF